MDSSRSNQESVAFEESANLEEIEEPGMDEDGTQMPGFTQSCQEEAGTSIANIDQIDAPLAVVNQEIGSLLNSEEACEVLSQQTLEENSQPASDSDFSLEIEGVGDPTIFWGINIDSKHPKICKEFRTKFDVETPTQGLVEELKQHPKVIIYPWELAVEIESDQIVENQVVYPANHGNSFVVGKMMFDVGINWSEFVGIPSEFKLLDPGGVGISHGVLVLEASKGVGFVFDPGITNGAMYCLKIIRNQLIFMPFDRGRIYLEETSREPSMVPFDRGKDIYISVALHVQLGFGLNIGVRLIFDPWDLLKSSLQIFWMKAVV